MATEVLMPALSPTMTEGKIARWLKSEGEPVRAGDVLAEIETDKATMEVEAIDEGVLAKIVIPEGTEHVAVNTPIAVIAGNGEEAGAADNARSGRQGAPRKPPRRSPPRPAPPPAASAVAQRAVPAETEYTGKTTTMTVREALRDAMAEEMRRDDTVFLIGEEVGRVPGSLQGQPGPAAGIRAAARHRHADHRAGLYRPRGRRRLCRPAADRRVHDLQLRDAGDRSDHQFGRQRPATCRAAR